MRISEFLNDLRNTFLIEGRKSWPKLLLSSLCIIVLVIISVLLLRLVPQPTLKQFTKYGYLGIFLICLLSNATVILPLPGIAVVATAVVTLQLNPILASVMASVGGSLGEITGYYVGYAGRIAFTMEGSSRYNTAKRWMKKWGGLAIFTFAVIPFLIFDFLGIAAGILRYPLGKFLLFCWMGRLPRSIIEIYLYGYVGKTFTNFVTSLLFINPA